MQGGGFQDSKKAVSCYDSVYRDMDTFLYSRHLKLKTDFDLLRKANTLCSVLEASSVLSSIPDIIPCGSGVFSSPLSLRKNVLIVEVRWEAGMSAFVLLLSLGPPGHMHSQRQVFPWFCTCLWRMLRACLHAEGVNGYSRVSCWEYFPGISGLA